MRPGLKDRREMPIGLVSHFVGVRPEIVTAVEYPVVGGLDSAQTFAQDFNQFRRQDSFVGQQFGRQGVKPWAMCCQQTFNRFMPFTEQLLHHTINLGRGLFAV